MAAQTKRISSLQAVVVNLNMMPSANTDDFSLWQAADFLLEHLKLLLLSAVTGALLGISAWYLLAPYRGQVIISVEKLRNVEKPGIAEAAIDYLGWLSIQQKFPLLVTKRLGVKNDGEEADLGALATSEWWQQNVTPTYAFGKLGTRPPAGLNKEQQDAEANSISTLVISDKQRSPEAVERRLRFAADIIREGGAYLTLQNLMTRYQSEVETGDAVLQHKISATELDMKYMKVRASSLEALRSRFPQSQISIGADVKIVPVVSQLVAVYSDIASAEESVARLRAQIGQIALKREFLAKATPMVAEEFAGLKLVDRLIDIEKGQRAKIPAAETDRLVVLDTLHSELLSIRARFSNGLVDHPATKPARPSFWFPLIGGMIGASLLATVWLWLWQGWARHRRA